MKYQNISKLFLVTFLYMPVIAASATQEYNAGALNMLQLVQEIHQSNVTLSTTTAVAPKVTSVATPVATPAPTATVTPAATAAVANALTLGKIQNMNYPQLTSAVSLNAVTVSGVVPVTLTGTQTTTPAFDFTYGTDVSGANPTYVSAAGFWFGATGSNGWNASAPVNDVTALCNNPSMPVNWTTGITFVTLPFDASNNYIADVAQTTPTQFHIFAYDTKTGTSLGAFGLSQTTPSDSTWFSTTQPWSNSGQLAVTGVSSVANITHPMAITFTSTGTAQIS